MDSIFTIGHNVYIYLNPETNKFVFIPWDKDLSFGGFFMFGSADQQAEMSLTHPYAGEFKLVDRLLADKEITEKYHNLIAELSRTCFSKDRLLQDLDAIENATKEPLAKEKKASEARKERAGGFGFGPPGGFGGTLDLRAFIDKRTSSVAAQLAGTSKGNVPTMGFGPGGRGGGPGGRGGPGGGPGGPGGFAPGGLGALLASGIVKRADADKDGKVSQEKFVAAAEALFKESDKDKNGSLDEQEIATAINLLLPAPNFGQPGGGFPGGGFPPDGP